ncbi:hypothetical protein Tco_0584103 [Tanacetum coccineum]
MLPEWGRFMMVVKLNRGLKESNHYQLYAYLKQHELHANENKILMERLNQNSHDPLTLVSNVSPSQYPSSSLVPPQPSYITPVTYQPQFTDHTQLDAGNRGAQYRAGNANAGQGKPIKLDLDEEQLLFLAGGQTKTFNDEVDEGPVQDMAQNKDNIFQADQFYDEAGLSYDSDTIFEVQDHDNCLDNMNESHKEHEMHNDVQQNDVVDSDIEYTSNSNIISYEQYVQDNVDQVLHSDVSFVPNDAVLIITNDIYEQDA